MIKTKKYTLPITEQEIEIKQYITGAQAEYAEEPLTSNVSLDYSHSKDGKIQPSGKINGKSLSEMNRRKIEAYVVRIGEVQEKVLETALNLPDPDYKFIRAKIDEIESENQKKATAQKQGE